MGKLLLRWLCTEPQLKETFLWSHERGVLCALTTAVG